MAELGANPIYCMWGYLSEIALEVADEYPDTIFILTGVNYFDPSIKINVAYVGNDQDPVKGQEVAKN